MQFICYAKCTTCQKARKWLTDHGIAFDERPIKEENPTADELKDWQQKSGLTLRRFFNTSGMLYRELKLTERLPQMGEDEQIALLASDGMLVKRPILINGDTVLVGFKEPEWSAALLNG